MNNFQKLEEATDGCEYLNFDQVENKRSKARDIHAFLLLEELATRDLFDVVMAAGYELIYLNVNSEEIDLISYDQALELNRCGVTYDEYSDRLMMHT